MQIFSLLKIKIMKIELRSKYAEYKVLNKYFGSDWMSKMFNNFQGYEEVREKNTYQEVYNELIINNHDNIF